MCSRALLAPFAAALALVLSLALARAGEAQPVRSCTVQRVIDGDTFVCEDGGRVRLLLVNTPEMGDEPLGRLAREYVRDLIPPGTGVRLEPDVRERDRYRRLLAFVRLPDGRLLNRVLAREGYAQVMVVPPNVSRVDEIRAAADSARRERAGLWGREGFGDGRGPPGRSRRERSHAPSGAADDSRCAASYPDVCIPPPPPDLDCRDVTARSFRVEGDDPHRFDGDRDGIGCEARRGVWFPASLSIML